MSDRIFAKIDQNENPKLKFEVTVSMLEIYNEQIFDLFVKDRPEKGLKIRQDKKLGVYVEGKKAMPVSCYSEIKHWNDVGESNRTVGATKMNATSSRAHTIFGIQ